MLAKSTELCASGYHQASWKYFNEGKMEEDESFQIVEQCQFYNDFRPVPTVRRLTMSIATDRQTERETDRQADRQITR